MSYRRKTCDAGACGRMDYESRIAELEAALRHVLQAVESDDRVKRLDYGEPRSYAHAVLRKSRVTA